MKTNYLYIFIYIALSGIVSACSSSWDDKYSGVGFEAVVSPTLAVDSEELTFPHGASSTTLMVLSNSRWTASSSAGWLTLDYTQGSGNAGITVIAEANNSTTQVRTAVITISNSIDTRRVTVTQAPLDEELRVASTALPYTFEGGIHTVGVSSNVAWSVSSNAAWLKVAKNGEESLFTATAEPNISSNSRQAVITVKGTLLSLTIDVSQTGVQAPKVHKLNVTNITKHEADCHFNAYSNDIDITEFGICYSSLAQTPSQANADVTKQEGGGRNVAHVFGLKGLKSKTTYYVRPYIVTALGTLYGDTSQFTTPASVPGEDDNETPND